MSRAKQLLQLVVVGTHEVAPHLAIGNCAGYVPLMVVDAEPEWKRVQEQRRAEARAAFTGRMIALLWLAIPLLGATLVIWLFGIGPHNNPIIAAMFAVLFFHGKRMRNEAAPGSINRATGFWICVWSAILLLVAFLPLSVMCLVGDTCPYSPGLIDVRLLAHPG